MIANELLRQPGAQAIGWALIHFVWQGALIGVVTAAVLLALRRSAADVRYVVATIGLSLMLTMPAVTAVQTWRAATADAKALAAPAAMPAERIAREARGATDGRRSASAAVSSSEQPPAREVVALSSYAVVPEIPRVEPWLPVLLFGWMCGVAVLTLRLASGWLWLHHMTSHGARPADESWRLMAVRLSRRLHISRSVRLLESTLVEVPTVIGWLKPVVLLPASALAGLAPHQLEAILAHELAHVRRHDYFVNLLQTLVETLLFYHPAVWWLSRTIRAERENCCDDLAVSLCGDPYTYARALADLEGLRGNRSLALAATGGSLLQRVRRLLGAPSHSGRPPGWLAGSAAIALMVGVAAGAIGSEAMRATQQGAAPAATAVPAVAPDRPARGATPARRSEQRPVAATTAQTSRQRAASELAGALRATTEAVRATSMELVRTAGPFSGLVVPVFVQPVTADRIAAALTGQTVAAVASTATATATKVEKVVEASLQSSSSGRQSGHINWSNNGEQFDIRYEGDIEFTEDDTDVRWISPRGYLRIREGGIFNGLTAEFRGDADGNIQRRFWVGGSEKPFDPQGRTWVAKALPRVIRQTGMGAPARVARILKSKGPAGVLTEISQIEGSWAKRVYFAHLFKSGALDAAAMRQALAQAGREIESDYELASLLIDTAPKLTSDDATRQAYFDAARTIQSDYELRRVFSASLKAPVNASTLAGILATSTSIDSDYELASLLVQIAKLQPLDATTRGPFFTALGTVSSAYEHHRVLGALASGRDVPVETLAAMLESGATLRSDYEQATFLLQVARASSIEGTIRTPFFRAVDRIQSPYERGRVLEAVARRTGASNETLAAVLRSAATMRGSYEKSQVLLAVASTHTITSALRDAYIDAAEGLGEYEQGRVLTALVKSERGRR